MDAPSPAGAHLADTSPETLAEGGIRVIPAATLVIFRSPQTTGAPPEPLPELLFVQRAREMRFAGGAVVFPGGRIDEADRALAKDLAAAHALAPDDCAARIAAIRETLEETGLFLALDRSITAAQAAEARRLALAEGALAPVLAHMGWSLAPHHLVPFARWCPMWEGSFDTHFYLADLGSGDVEIAADATENTQAFWMSAADALAAADRGEISVIFPTRRNLERLATFASFGEARAQAEAIPARMITPRRVMRDGREWLIIPEGLGYPVRGQPLDTVKRG